MPRGIFIRTEKGKANQSIGAKAAGVGKWNKGKTRSEEFKKRISEYQTGRKKPNAGLWSKEHSGEFSPRWKGGDRHVIAHKKYYRKYPERQRARGLALKKIPLAERCQICGEKAYERHHIDYSKPLDVMFLCVKCHKTVHVLQKILEGGIYYAKEIQIK